MGRKVLIDMDLACKIGNKETYVLSQINYWLHRKPHWRDGKPWIYNTYEKWADQIPCFGIASIKSAVSKLRQLGLIESGEFNRIRSDRTRWYTINYDHPILKECEVGWISPKTSSNTCTGTVQNLDDASIKLIQSHSTKLIRSNHKNITTDEKQKIILKEEGGESLDFGLEQHRLYEDSVAIKRRTGEYEIEENWIESHSRFEKEQIEKFIKQTMLRRKDAIRDRRAYRAKLIRNIREGVQKDFEITSNEKGLWLAARHYGPPDLKTLKDYTPPADWPRIRAEFELAQSVG